MVSKSRSRWLDLPVSLLLGIVACALLGYLLGLRILIWNPELIANPGNILYLSLSMVYLYGLLGAGIGVIIWFLVRIYSRLTLSNTSGRAFLGPWLIIYLGGAAIVLGYLALTRQHLRSGSFDNLVLIVYYLSLIFLAWWFHRSARTRPDRLSGRSRLFTLPKFLFLFVIYLVVAAGATIFSIPRAAGNQGLGDPAEIRAAQNLPVNGSRVALIGWDGAEWSVIDKLFAQGQLPNLKRLVDGGVSAPLRSLDVLKSPLIWTSIATGKVPAKHGISDFGSFQFAGMPNNFRRYPDGMGLYKLISKFEQSADLPITSSIRNCQALWNILSDAGRNVGLVGWWASWPAEKVHGFILSDRFTYTLFNPRASVKTLTTGQTYPPELLSEMTKFCRLPDSMTDQEIGRFIPHAGEFSAPSGWNGRQIDWNPMYQLRMSYTASESFARSGLALYQQNPPDFFGIYFEGVDMVSHFFWQYYNPEMFDSVPREDVDRFGNVLPEFYRYMDEILGQYLAVLQPGTDVILVSDHGFGPDPHPQVPFRTGDHRPNGIFVANGPHFRQGVHLDSTNVLDITPTVLYLFGLPEARDMDGHVLTATLDSSFVTAHPAVQIKSYEIGRRVSSLARSSADERIKDQIRALGYTQ